MPFEEFVASALLGNWRDVDDFVESMVAKSSRSDFLDLQDMYAFDAAYGAAMRISSAITAQKIIAAHRKGVEREAADAIIGVIRGYYMMVRRNQHSSQ